MIFSTNCFKAKRPIFFLISWLVFFIESSLLALTPVSVTKGEELFQQKKIDFFPLAEKSFKPLIADPREHQFAVVFLDERDLYCNIGSYFTLLKGDFPVGKEIWNFSFGGAATLFNYMFRLNSRGAKKGFRLDTIDAKFGFFSEFIKDRYALRASMMHLSGHLSDGLNFSLQTIDSERYSRESLEIVLAYSFNYLRPYLGVIESFHIGSPDQGSGGKDLEGLNLIAFQGGGELVFPTGYKNINIFMATDFQARQENDFFISRSYLSGIEIKGKRATPLRVALVIYDGIDPRGNFWLSKQRYYGGGFIYPF